VISSLFCDMYPCQRCWCKSLLHMWNCHVFCCTDTQSTDTLTQMVSLPLTEMVW